MTIRPWLIAAALLATPTPAPAWGAEAHREIMARAIELLPAPIRPFFEQHRTELVLRVNDPDTWRVVGWDEAPNHFVNFGRPGLGPYPFEGLPRDHAAALAKFGAETLARIGRLPWRQAEQFGNLRRAFERSGRGAGPADLVLFAAVASHYVQDAHVPLHATNNGDGQLTGQRGVHARFESALFERYRSRLTLTPAPRPPIADARGAAFAILLASHRLVPRLLQADRDAAGGRPTYDDAYFDRFFAAAKTLLEERLAASIEASAALIAGAWEAAGRPPLRVQAGAPGAREPAVGLQSRLDSPDLQTP